MSTIYPVAQRAMFMPRQLGRSPDGEPIKTAAFVGLGGHSIEKLATDAIGSVALTFDGVNAGSEIRVLLADGTEQAGVESCDADHVLTGIPLYPAGSPNNDVTIHIVALGYKIKELTYTVTGTAVIPIQQDRDPWYSNP